MNLTPREKDKLLVAMAALLVFMFWSSRRRAKRMKDEQEAKARAMLPGVKVLLQGGLYGTLVEYDGDAGVARYSDGTETDGKQWRRTAA